MCLLYFYGLHTNYYTDDISGTFAKVEKETEQNKQEAGG